MNLSTVTICRNETTIITQLLDCLVMLKPAESIFVDDDSTDDTIEIIQSYRDRLNVKVFTHSLESYGEQRNLALEKVTGDYILTLDADETISKNILELMHSIDTDKFWGKFLGFSFPTLDMVSKDHYHNTARLQPHVRLWKKDKNIRYIREVHEYLVYFIGGNFYDLNISRPGIPSVYLDEVAVLHWHLFKSDVILLDKGKRFFDKFGKASGAMGLPMPDAKHFVRCKKIYLTRVGQLIKDSWR